MPPKPTKKRQKAMANSTQIIDIDKHSQGDLVVKVGKLEKSRIFRVHSNVLKMASPVFRTMLGPNFAEGTQKYDDTNPLKLEDDDATSFKYLFQILHHQDMSKDLKNLSWVSGLLLAADKYQCIPLVKPLLSNLMGELLGKHVTQDPDRFDDRSLPRLHAVCIAYVIGDATLFHRTTRLVVAKIAAGEWEEGMPEGLLDLMPLGFLQRLKRIQIEERAYLVGAVKEEIEGMFKGCHAPCNLGSKIVGTLLYKTWLWENQQGSYAGYNLNLVDSWVAIHTIAEEWEEDFEVEVDNEQVDDDCGCRYDYGAELRALVHSHKCCFRGFCLECERAGGKQGPVSFGQCGHKFDR